MFDFAPKCLALDAYIDGVVNRASIAVLLRALEVDPAVSCIATDFRLGCDYAVPRSQTAVIANVITRVLPVYPMTDAELFGSFCDSDDASELSEALNDISPNVASGPASCRELLRGGRGSFRLKAQQAKRMGACLGMGINVDRPDQGDPTDRYMREVAPGIRLQAGWWGVITDSTCLPGPAYSSIVADMAMSVPPDLRREFRDLMAQQ